MNPTSGNRRIIPSAGDDVDAEEGHAWHMYPFCPEPQLAYRRQQGCNCWLADASQDKGYTLLGGVGIMQGMSLPVALKPALQLPDAQIYTRRKQSSEACLLALPPRCCCCCRFRLSWRLGLDSASPSLRCTPPSRMQRLSRTDGMPRGGLGCLAHMADLQHNTLALAMCALCARLPCSCDPAATLHCTKGG